jgi:hypothetical protein
MSNAEVGEFVLGRAASSEAELKVTAEALLDECLQKGSRDNMSAVFASFPLSGAAAAATAGGGGGGASAGAASAPKAEAAAAGAPAASSNPTWAAPPPPPPSPPTPLPLLPRAGRRTRQRRIR